MGSAAPPPSWQYALAGYIPMVTGNLSVIGSSLIVYSILGPAGRRAKKFQNQPHLRLLLGMSFLDILYSSAKAWTVLLSPVGHGMPGAVGNMATCRLQGFIIQMAHSTAAYNAALSTYYWLTVCRGMKKERWVAFEPYLHATILLLNVILGTIGVATRLYNPSISVCFIATYPAGCEMGPGAPPCKYYSLSQMNLMYELFANMWLQAYIIIVFVTSFAIWYKVYSQERAMRRYRHGNATRQEGGGRRRPIYLLSSMLSSLRQSTATLSRSSSRLCLETTEFSQRDLSARGDDDQNGQQQQRQQQRQERREVKRNHQVLVQCVLYAGSFFLCWIGPVMFHLIGWIHNYQSIAFVMVIVLFTPLQGFFNAFAYGRPTYLRIRRKYPRITRWDAFKRVFFAEDPMAPVCATDSPVVPTEQNKDGENKKAIAGIVNTTEQTAHAQSLHSETVGGGILAEDEEEEAATERNTHIGDDDDEDNDVSYDDSSDDDDLEGSMDMGNDQKDDRDEDKFFKDEPSRHRNVVRAAIEEKAVGTSGTTTTNPSTKIADVDERQQQSRSSPTRPDPPGWTLPRSNYAEI